MRDVAAVIVASVLGVGIAAATDARDPQHREALDHYRVGQDSMHGEAWERAEREFSAAIKLDPLLTLAHYGLGQTYMALRRYSDAVRAFMDCREAFRQVAALSQADSATSDRRLQEEIEEVKDSIRLFESGRIKTGNAFTIMKLEDRVRELENIRRRDVPDFETPAEVSLALGSAYFRSGSLAEAEREYVAATKANPKLGEAHNNLAVIYMMSGRLDEAHQELKLAEKSGFRINPRFKEDLESRRGH